MAAHDRSVGNFVEHFTSSTAREIPSLCHHLHNPGPATAATYILFQSVNLIIMIICQTVRCTDDRIVNRWVLYSQSRRDDSRFCGMVKQVVAPWLAFTASMFTFYCAVPFVLRWGGAAVLNLSLLTSDLWVAAARVLFFGAGRSVNCPPCLALTSPSPIY